MRTQNLLVSLSLALLAACTPISPNKAKDNGKCFTNADCASGTCAKGICTTAVDCAQDANASNVFCQDRACVVDNDCPSDSYYCGAGRCVFGEKPPCVNDSDCADPKPFCLAQGGDTNLCVECLKPSDCGEGTCKEFACVTGGEEGCATNEDCAENEEGLLLCDKKAMLCVECLSKKDCASKGPTWDCRSNACSDATVVQDCNTAGCPQKKLPICVASTGACVGCTNAPAGTTCKVGLTCDSTPASPTFNECVSQAQVGECGSNADCDTTLTGPTGPVPGPTGSTFWCDLGNINNPAKCKECRLNQNDCGAGFTCTTQAGGVETCVPQMGTPCATAATCMGDDASCVGGLCGTACVNASDCKAGKQCVGNVCQSPATCTTNASCTTGGNYNGLTCRGAPLSCQPCVIGADCTNGPGGAVGGATECNTTSKLCIVPPVTTSPLGAVCTNNADCTSGVCHRFASNYPAICTSLCARTLTTASEPDNDCPTAPAASLVSAGPARAGVAPLTANQGFVCATVSGAPQNAPAFDGLGLCLHAVDDIGIYGTPGLTGLSGAYTLPAGAAAVSGETCQFGFVLANGTCAAGCGTNSDCDGLTPSVANDYVCRELLTNVGDTEVSAGLRYCSQNTDALGEGKLCEQASDCREEFCAGTCIQTRVVRLLPNGSVDTCSTNAGCVAGDLCVSGRCYRPTIISGSSCTDDSQCTGTNRCWAGKCYEAAAETDRLCQDRYSCADSTLQICAGRCASHCNEQTDCPSAAAGQVCAYAPGAPGYNPSGNPTTFVDGFVGASWTRVCAAPSVPSPNAQFDHFLPRGGNCDFDTECESQVCVNSRCSDFCGRSSVCEANEKCTLVPRSVAADDASSIVLLQPVCVIP